jgi:hypothetical protein
MQYDSQILDVTISTEVFAKVSEFLKTYSIVYKLTSSQAEQVVVKVFTKELQRECPAHPDVDAMGAASPVAKLHALVFLTEARGAGGPHL